jgi:hypothetical protein
MAEIFVGALPGMRKRIDAIAPPFIFGISRGGDFNRLE